MVFSYPNIKYVRVSYPSPECYFVIPNDWNPDDLTVKHGQLFHKGKASMLPAHDFVSKKHDIEIIDEHHMEWEDVKSFVGN